MVEDDDLGDEHVSVSAWVILRVGSDVASLDILDGEILDVEADVVTWEGLLDLLVMHLDGLDLSGGVHGAKGDDHASLDGTGLDTTDGHCSNTANLVHILEGKTERLVNGSLGWAEGVKGLEKVRAVVPWHVIGGLDHIVAN